MLHFAWTQGLLQLQTRLKLCCVPTESALLYACVSVCAACVCVSVCCMCVCQCVLHVCVSVCCMCVSKCTANSRDRGDLLEVCFDQKS